MRTLQDIRTEVQNLAKTIDKCQRKYPNTSDWDEVDTDFEGFSGNEMIEEHFHTIEKMIGEVEEQRDAAKKRWDRQWHYPTDLFNQLLSKNSPYAFYIFAWVDYQKDAKQWRLKMRHDVKTFDGRVEYGIWPNADKCGSFHDDEVEFIRISKDQGWDNWEDLRDNPCTEII